MKPNVILLTVDSLRGDHLGFMGYRKDITPNMDKLARDSSIFRQAFSTGPVTPHSFPSILTSTYPFDYQGVGGIERPRVLISEVFKKHGFITAAFHSNPYLSAYFGYNKGWDYFEDITPPFDIPEGKIENKRFSLVIKNFLEDLLKRIAFNTFPELYFKTRYFNYRRKGPTGEFKVKANYVNQIVKDFISFAKQEGKPFFVWVHYMDLHIPYISVDKYLQNGNLSYPEMVCSFYCSASLPHYFEKKALIEFGKKYVRDAIQLYDGLVMYVDQQIGDLMEFLQKGNLYDTSLLCLTADHGDEFFEHNGLSHTSKLYNELLHVPLVIKFPKSKIKKVLDQKISLISLAPTICDIVEIPKASFKGNNLFEDGDAPIFHQTASGIRATNLLVQDLGQCKIACQHGKWKYIIDYGIQREELYNLDGDLKEQYDLSRFEKETIYQMRKIVQEFLKQNSPFSLLKK